MKKSLTIKKRRFLHLYINLSYKIIWFGISWNYRRKLLKITNVGLAFILDFKQTNPIKYEEKTNVLRFTVTMIKFPH